MPLPRHQTGEENDEGDYTDDRGSIHKGCFAEFGGKRRERYALATGAMLAGVKSVAIPAFIRAAP